ncbi:hypothetical protein SRB17_83890 [Streptomyces sp. RB17]|nr:hypothetical protein [Streptomyces sp. RB17]
MAGGPQLRAHAVAVRAGQHDVQDNHVVILLLRQVQTGDAVMGRIHGEALGAQAAGQGGGEAFLVLHDQESKGAARSASGRAVVGDGRAHASSVADRS